jgi:hypothetical protein
MSGEILVFDTKRRTNAQLMLDCRTLGYLSDEMTILDPTYGQGRFWSKWRPDGLVMSDGDPGAGVTVIDFTKLPFSDSSFDAVVFDPPYKLNGTSAHPSDEGYGVGGPYSTVEGRIGLILDGCAQAARVASTWVLVKCQDQTVSGRKVWQTDRVTEHMSFLGWEKEARLEVYGHIPQPMEGRTQRTPHSVSSQLLVFRPAKGKAGASNDAQGVLL